MAGYVTKLEAGQTLSAKEHFDGAWREFSRSTLAAGEVREFVAADAEYSIFVIRGTGSVRIGARREELTPGSAITVAYRASAAIEAASDELELFVTTLDVDVTSGL